MKYTIAPSDDGMFIAITVKGNVTGKNTVQMNLEAHALGEQLHIKRYLVDMTEARNIDTNIGNYEFINSDMNRNDGIDRFAQVAVLVSPNDHSHDFIALLAENSGLLNRMFTDPNDAKRFLIGNTEDAICGNTPLMPEAH